MSTSLTIETVPRDNGRRALIASGEIDLSNIDAFKQALNAATAEVQRSDEALIVDLSAVHYLDSAAINTLFVSADHIENVIAHPLLMTTLTVSGLTELVSVEPARPT